MEFAFEEEENKFGTHHLPIPSPKQIPANLFQGLPDLQEWVLFNTNTTGTFPDVTPSVNLKRLVNFRNNFTDWNAPDWSVLEDLFYVDFAQNSLQMFINLNDFNLTTASEARLNELTLRLHTNFIQGERAGERRRRRSLRVFARHVYISTTVTTTRFLALGC